MLIVMSDLHLADSKANDLNGVRFNHNLPSEVYISFFKDLSGDAADQADANDKILLYLKDEGSEFYEARKYMIQSHLIERGITDEAVLTAMGTVKRQLFVDIRYTDIAYNDHPLPIGEGQTISQPYIVALMTQAIGVRPGDRVLEIGTGSGYQAAVLSEITSDVYSIEIIEGLVETALANLEKAGYDNVRIKCADGYFGWEEAAPFDAVMITCAANHIPPPLLAQLKDGGKLIIPLGDTTYYQTLTLVTKEGDDYVVDHLTYVAFVPMTGEAIKEE